MAAPAGRRARDRAPAGCPDPDLRTCLRSALQPVVTVADRLLSPRERTGHRTGGWSDLGLYVVVQVVGAIAGAVLANPMFGVPAAWSTHDRSSWRIGLAEVVATASVPGFILAQLIGAAAGICLVLALYPEGRHHD